jgi:hypothetical protein
VNECNSRTYINKAGIISKFINSKVRYGRRGGEGRAHTARRVGCVSRVTLSSACLGGCVVGPSCLLADLSFLLAQSRALAVQQRLKPQKLTWTLGWRRLHKKISTTEGGKAKKKKSAFVCPPLLGFATR